MEPPAYSPPEEQSVAPRRAIQDLRAQIIANASVMRPKSNSHRDSSDHIEVIVAKAPARSAKNPRYDTNWSEKETVAMFQPPGPEQAPSIFQPSYKERQSSQSSARASNQPTAPVPSSSPSTVRASPLGSHYAVLIKRSNIGKINIILKGEPKDTVEEALEWMLERTEMLMHDLVVRRGRPDDGLDGCHVM